MSGDVSFVAFGVGRMLREDGVPSLLSCSVQRNELPVKMIDAESLEHERAAIDSREGAAKAPVGLAAGVQELVLNFVSIRKEGTWQVFLGDHDAKPESVGEDV